MCDSLVGGVDRNIHGSFWKTMQPEAGCIELEVMPPLLCVWVRHASCFWLFLEDMNWHVSVCVFLGV